MGPKGGDVLRDKTSSLPAPIPEPSVRFNFLPLCYPDKKKTLDQIVTKGLGIENDFPPLTQYFLWEREKMMKDRMHAYMNMGSRNSETLIISHSLSSKQLVILRGRDVGQASGCWVRPLPTSVLVNV